MHLLWCPLFGPIYSYQLSGYSLSRNNLRESLSAHSPPSFEILGFEALEIRIRKNNPR